MKLGENGQFRVNYWWKTNVTYGKKSYEYLLMWSHALSSHWLGGNRIMKLTLS